MPNLLIIGPANNGKTMLVEKFCRRYPPKPTNQYSSEMELQPYEALPILSLQMPSNPDVKRFYRLMLDILGRFIRPTLHISELETFLFRELRLLQIKMLIIDEIHNMLA